MPTQVAAAGAVLWRMREGRQEIAVVHRPRYDDWSLPKGKLEHNERPLAAAVREIGEETGARVATDRRLGQVRYRLDAGFKVVDYWSMRYRDGEFVASDEVDEVQWLDPPAAAAKLSYPLDREVLARLTALPPTDSVVILLRHAKAGKRSGWKGDDRLRPLERDGRLQAQRLVGFLSGFGATRVVSADLVRCIQTVVPYAESIGTTVVDEAAFADATYAWDPQRSLTALRALTVAGNVTVVCSQGDTIPGLVEALELIPAPQSLATRKAAAWALSFIDGEVVAADYYEDAIRP
jgi:8-oxo-dGTP diphosphatase